MPHVFKPKSISELLEYVQSRRFLEINGEVLTVLKEEANYPECQSSLDKFVNICESLVSSNGRGASAGFALVYFLITRPVFNLLWRIKLRFTGRKENSAMFVMSRTKIKFIDQLAQV
jgi:hypothetical protein